MTHAVVLVEAERDAMAKLGRKLADLEGVRIVYSVTGEWDFVAIVSVERHEELAEVISAKLAGIAGVARTQTMVAFEPYSTYDLNAVPFV